MFGLCEDDGIFCWIKGDILRRRRRYFPRGDFQEVDWFFGGGSLGNGVKRGVEKGLFEFVRGFVWLWMGGAVDGWCCGWMVLWVDLVKDLLFSDLYAVGL